MAHVQKFTASSASNILGHCEREFSQDGKYLKYRTNSDIDISRTHLNYSLSVFNDSAKERLQKRLSEVYVLNRKDVNIMCDWVITAPKEIIYDEEKLTSFFSNTFDFLSERYGKQNLISCNVHMDEVTPHLHYCFVPVVYDKKKNRYKVSAFEVLNKTELKKFHNDLGNYLQKQIGIDKSLISNGITKKQGGNKSIHQLKMESLENKAKEINQQIMDFQSKLDEIIERVKNTKEWKNIEIAIKEEEHYNITPSRWFERATYVEGCKIKKTLRGEIIEAPLEAFNCLFKVRELSFRKNELIELQKSLRNEIRALYDYDPDLIIEREKKITNREKELTNLEFKISVKEERLNNAIKRQKNINRIADNLERDNKALKKYVEEMKDEIISLQIRNNSQCEEIRSYENCLREINIFKEELEEKNKIINEYEKTLNSFGLLPKVITKGFEMER